MKRLALVVPEPEAEVVVNAPPLNLGYLASYIRENSNTEVKIIDGVVQKGVIKRLEDFQPDIIGVTATTPMIYDAQKLLVKISNKFSEVQSVIGGVHPTVMPEESQYFADVVIVGEGEKVLLDIVTSNRRTHGIIQGKPIMNLDEIPSPAYDLMDMEKYFETRDGPGFYYPYGLEKARTAPLITSRGCSYRCVFCRNSGRSEPVRFHSAQRIIDEIEYFLEKYSVNSLFFLDDAFTANRKRIYEFGKLYKERGLTVPWGCQAKTPNLTTKYIQFLKSINCKFVSPGFESGNPRMLKFLKKGCVTVEQNHQAILNCEKVGMKIGGSFIFGSPTETWKEMNDTVKFIEDHPQLCFIGINMLVPYPGTEVWEKCKRMGILPEKIDYRKLIPTAQAKKTYALNGSENIKFYTEFATDIQRRTWMISKVNLVNQMYNHPVKHFLPYIKLKTFWYNALKHPKLTTKLFTRLIREEIKSGN